MSGLDLTESFFQFEFGPQTKATACSNHVPESSNKYQGHNDCCAPFNHRLLLRDKETGDCHHPQANYAKPPPGSRCSWAGMRVSLAHGALPYSPEAKRNQRNKKDVGDVEASDSMCTSGQRAEETEIIAVRHDFLFKMIHAVQNEQ